MSDGQLPSGRQVELQELKLRDIELYDRTVDPNFNHNKKQKDNNG